MDKIIWLIDDDWYAGDKASNDSVGPYIHADEIRGLVKQLRDEQYNTPVGRGKGICADRIEKLLNGGE